MSVDSSNHGVRKSPLRGLDFRAFVHPFDQAARARMEAIPILPQLSEWFSASVIERAMLHEYLSSGLRVTPRQYPGLYRRFIALADVLDVAKLPQLFVINDPIPGAYASGQAEYAVAVTGTALDVMSDRELEFVLAHELGHVKCDHMRWMSVANVLKWMGAGGLSALLLRTGGGAAGAAVAAAGSALIIAAEVAILEWSRKAEFTADRAGLLGCQDLEAAQSALGKLAVGSSIYPEAIDRSEMLLQADALEESFEESLVSRAIHYGGMLARTHPYIPMRVRDIGRWHADGEMDRIVGGGGRGSAPSPGASAAVPPPPPPPPRP